MKGILVMIFCVVLFVAIVLAILFHEQVRNFRKVLQRMADARAARREAEEEAYFKRTSNKYYQEDQKPKFKDDYFKSADDGQPRQQQRQKAAPRETVATDGGVTVTVERGTGQADRKIFDDGEGEYVDFEEV